MNQCRNGTEDSFTSVNITAQDAPAIIVGFVMDGLVNGSVTVNRTVKRDEIVATTTKWPCPTVLSNGAGSKFGVSGVLAGFCSVLALVVSLSLL